MKQEYRHTKPIRGKDPDFKEEEIKEQEKESCPQCGGFGGELWNDSPFEGYLPCYKCGL
tara:strand:+ start:171 stop:347 length:177 start_codon:yes stop_codon:yes gene_type:complete